MWGLVTPQHEQKLLTTDDFGFKSALEKGVKMMRHDRVGQSATDILKYYIPGNNNPIGSSDSEGDYRREEGRFAAREAERQRQAAEAERARQRLAGEVIVLCSTTHFCLLISLIAEARVTEEVSRTQREEAERIRQA
jgi:hypothetical protein